MVVQTLASGSSGNATLVVCHDEVLIIDFGVSRKYISDCLSKLHLSFANVVGILITHEHSDHISGLSKKDYPLVKTAPATLRFLDSSSHLALRSYTMIGHFVVYPYRMSHDAYAPYGYLICCGEEKLVIVSDTGQLHFQDFEKLKNATYYIMESNHDQYKSFQTERPLDVKLRNVSLDGHLSNEAAGTYLSLLIGEHTKGIILSHLSKEANTPEICLATVKKILAIHHFLLLKSIDIKVAKPHEIVRLGEQNGN
jgi:phosphoribosyl 1,2-cyclic phosphodiesterase